jgi:hypothetical protein
VIDLDTWGYLGVFGAAATPWLEILLVIPAGVAVGLEAVPVGAVAFVGNALPVAGIVYAHDAVAGWRARRLGREADRQARSGRAQRARRIMQRYGLPALALAGPIVTGIHLATAIALLLGGRKAAILAWMTLSLVAWTVVITALSAVGAAVVRG